MAAADPRQNLLTFIRHFAEERSQGERRVSDLRKRAAELAPELDAADARLEAAKRSKETAERELRGAEVELALSDAAVVAHESRILLLQEEISKIGSDISSLKNEEDRTRDEFINKMSGFNKEIRKFYEAIRNASSKDTQRLPVSAHDKLSTEDTTVEFMPDGQESLKKLEDQIALVRNQTHTLELEYLEEQDTYNKVLQEVADLEKRLLLVESIAKEMKELQELARQIAESEQQFAAAVQELKKRYTCPRCQTDNMGKPDVAMVAE